MPRMQTADPRAVATARLLEIVDRLRAPDGCPWDREQTLESMAPHLVEEAHELLEAIERGDEQHAAEEAGDVLMNVAMICRIAEESGRFDLAAVAAGIAEKLVRRHPHVFGDVRAEDPDAALASWEAVKKREREAKEEHASALDGVPASLPALQRARRTCEKAVAAGFRWPGAAGALAKLVEELGELREALAPAELGGPGKPELAADVAARAEEELGDVLLAGAFLGTYLGVDPERACRAAIRRFEARFRRLEDGLDRPMGELELEELVARWRAAKAAERGA